MCVGVGECGCVGVWVCVGVLMYVQDNACVLPGAATANLSGTFSCQSELNPSSSFPQYDSQNVQCSCRGACCDAHRRVAILVAQCLSHRASPWIVQGHLDRRCATRLRRAWKTACAFWPRLADLPRPLRRQARFMHGGHNHTRCYACCMC